ncbi:unnamed protein product [Ectocarpus fasciculatus]
MEVLQSSVQQYAWGKKGSDSVVAKLKGLGDAEYTVKPEENYAEMWIGTHPSGPSRVVRDGSPGPLLKEILDDNPHVLGAIRWKGDLPFLFKVISISKALSIQAHPDKRLAERLHAERPDVYKDDNHKPEMAVTLSDFEGLCGFRPFYEIVWNLHAYPELRSMVSYGALKAVCKAGDDVERQRSALKKLFGSFVKCDKNVVRTQVAALVSRLEKNLPAEATPDDDVSASMTGLKIDQAPEPLREVLAAKTAAGQDASNGGAVPDEQKTLSKNPSMHLGGYVFKGGEQGGAPSPPPTLGTVPSFSVGSPSRDGGDCGDAGVSSPPGAEERKRAEDVLVDKSEEIFGKAFRGGPKAAAGLMARLQREDADTQRVMLRLSKEYPGDLGILMPLMLNLLQLKPGLAFFMTVDEPHAYLRGDILEVMACSNNVVRAALTPKFRDVNLLVEMLTYNMGAPAVLPAETVDACRKRYTPPINDFEIQILQVPANERYELEAMPVPVVMVALEGGDGGRVIESKTDREIKACEGGVFFLPAFTPVQVCSGSTGAGIKMALAHTNLHWGMLAVAQTAGHKRRASASVVSAGHTSTAQAILEATRRGSAIAPAFA